MVLALFLLLRDVANCAAIQATIRASYCVANATHCHCTFQHRHEGLCYRPLAGISGYCIEDKCLPGFQCDCSSNVLCIKEGSVIYLKANAPKLIQEYPGVTCEAANFSLPVSIVARTTDITVTASGEFEVFINHEQIGYGDGDNVKTITAHISHGDVLGIHVQSGADFIHGVKLRFEDFNEDIRHIDQ